MPQNYCKEKVEVFPKKEYTRINEVDVVGFNEEVKIGKTTYLLETDFKQDPKTGSAILVIKKCYKYIGESPDGTAVLLTKRISSSLTGRLERILNENYAKDPVSIEV